MLQELLGGMATKTVITTITNQLRTKLLDFRDEYKLPSAGEVRVVIQAIDEKIHLKIALFKASGGVMEYIRDIRTEELLGGLMEFKDKVEKAMRITTLLISDEPSLQCPVTDMLFILTPIMNEKGEHKGNFVIALYKITTGKKEYIREVKLEEIIS